MNPIFSFDTAKRVACKASILIEGLSGRGKSGLALMLAEGLASSNDKVYAIDTENKSLNLFSGLTASSGKPFDGFKVGQLTEEVGFKPSNYLAFRDVAIQNGAEVVIQDSISHAWQYKGGVLDIVSQKKATSTRYQKDNYAAWGDEEVVKEKNELLTLIRSDKVHVISTVRVKEKMEYGTDDKGKTILVSLGEQQIQQADLKYEPDLVLQMVTPGRPAGNGAEQHPQAIVTKSRYAIFETGETYTFTPALIQQLKAYLEEGVSPEEIMAQQHKEYVDAVTAYLDEHKNAVPIWQVLKEDAGFKDVKLADIPLSSLKELFIKLTT